MTQMSRSWNHKIAGAVLGDDSLGPFDIYTAATGDVVSGQLNNFSSYGSLNKKGTTYLIDGSYVIDAATGSLLGTISDDRAGAVLNASGRAATAWGRTRSWPSTSAGSRPARRPRFRRAPPAPANWRSPRTATCSLGSRTTVR